jgi:hypothetical protein
VDIECSAAADLAACAVAQPHSMFTFRSVGAVVDERGRAEPEGMALEAAIAEDDEPILSHAAKLIIAATVFALGGTHPAETAGG